MRLRNLSLETRKTDEIIGEEAHARLKEEIELVDGASADFDMKAVTEGRLTPVFFGSALNNFGVSAFWNISLK